MSRVVRRILLAVVNVVVILAIVFAVTGTMLVKRSFPIVMGRFQAPGLNDPVDIYRDSYGIPHLYASTAHDLFFAQGYVHAQDRFWQMDFWRHTGAGRLSELLGKSTLDTDIFLRTLGWERVAQEELKNLAPEELAILQAYADGVNAYLADHSGSALSLEYAILPLINAGYQPKPWTPVNTLTWAKAMAWDLRGNMDEEIRRAILLKLMPAGQVNELFPPYPASHPYIIPGTQSSSFSVPKAEQAAALPVGLSVDVLRGVRLDIRRVSDLLEPLGRGIGSNNWVISGQRTATGKPMLANDPHLSAQMPSIWYEVGLHCTPRSDQCPFEVAGFSFAGVPGVVIGHNNRIAWGVTNVGPDVQDLYIEKINPANPDEYEYRGEWKPMQVIEDVIQVGSSEQVPIKIRMTQHGPIISGLYEDLDEFGQKAGIELPGKFDVALRWTALEPAYIYKAIWGFNKAQNWDEFRQAARYFTVPAQNLVYADVDGNIGYQMPGAIPVRTKGNGTLPVPGWTGEYEWTGFIPFEDLPHVYNPPQGYIATANNAVVSPDYPYLITTNWDTGFRSQRIVDMIENAPGPIDAAYIQTMQGDNGNLNAATLMPILMAVPLNDAHLDAVRQLFVGWNYQDHMDSAPAALFSAFWKHLLTGTFHDDLPEQERPAGSDDYWLIVQNLVKQPGSTWWDNQATGQAEMRDEIFRQAFKGAVEELEMTFGADPKWWSWGSLHTTTFRNATLGKSGIAPIEALFNRGPYRTSGSSADVNATSWDAVDGYTVRWLPSMRMIVDLNDLRQSVTVNTLGQSGHAYHPHYNDMADLWRNIGYHRMLWAQEDVFADSQGHLQLIP